MESSVIAVASPHRHLPLFPETCFEGIRLSRWSSSQNSARRVLLTGSDEYLVMVSLQSARIELRRDAASLFDGVFGAGTAHITGPSCRIEAAVRGPCDLLHLHIPAGFLQARLRSMSPAGAPRELDGCILRDSLIGQLALVLASAETVEDDNYGGSVAYALLTRILRKARDHSKSGTLPKWRLRRVQSLIDQKLCHPLTLRDLATAAGLSPMHFAAQFRATTGCSPRHYLRCQRIEAAKELLSGSELSLVEIALTVGFTAQAHFTTVFRRLTGETPGRWRRARRDSIAGTRCGEAASWPYPEED